MAYTAQPVGFLASVVQRVREYADEASDDAKYPSDRLYPLIRDAFQSVILDAFSMHEGKVSVRYTISLVADQERYYIPRNVGTIHKLGRLQDDGRILPFTLPRSRLNPGGPGYAIDGPCLRFTPAPAGAEDIVLEYIPNGTGEIHLSTQTANASGNSTTSFKLDTTPDEGYYDRAPNAYLGCMLRLLSSSGSPPSGYASFPIQERVITAFNVATSIVTVAPAFDFNPTSLSTDTITYEVVPFLGPLTEQAVALDVACRLHEIAGRSDRLRTLRPRANNAARDFRFAMTAMDANRAGLGDRDVYPGTSKYGLAWELGNY